MIEVLKPGLYKAHIFGKDRVGLVDHAGDFTYNNAGGVSVVTPVVPRMVEDNLRPLIVLDLTDYLAHTLALDLRQGRWGDIADQIMAQLKPARIPELGWDGKVLAHTATDSKRREFVRFSRKAGLYTWADGNDHMGSVPWNALIDPVLIREGVTS